MGKGDKKRRKGPKVSISALPTDFRDNPELVEVVREALASEFGDQVKIQIDRSEFTEEDLRDANSLEEMAEGFAKEEISGSSAADADKSADPQPGGEQMDPLALLRSQLQTLMGEAFREKLRVAIEVLSNISF